MAATPEPVLPRLKNLDTPPRFRGVARYLAPSQIQGWIFDTRAPDSSVALELRVNGLAVAELGSALKRADLDEAYGRTLNAGFGLNLKQPQHSKRAWACVESLRESQPDEALRRYSIQLVVSETGSPLRFGGHETFELSEAEYIESFALARRAARVEREWAAEQPSSAKAPGTLVRGEGDILPTAPAALPPAPWVVFAPHADDEAIGLGGAMQLAVVSGREVHVIIVTDGALGGDAQQRRAEAHAYAVQAGLTSLEILDAPDRGLSASPEWIARFGAILKRLNARTVFAPGPFEPHPDHRACLVTAWLATQQHAPTAGFCAYEITAQNPINAGFDISAVAETKYALLSCYASQVAQNDYVDLTRTLDRFRAYTFGDAVSAVEGFYRYERLDAPSPFIEAEAWLRRRAGEIDPLVSVVVRTYNRPQLLAEAIASLRAQSYRSLELVVVNDAGVDVADQVAVGGAIVSARYVHLSENRGRAGAANAGLEAASGRFIAFLDDDDLIEPQHYMQLVTTLREHPAQLAAYSGVRMVPKPDDFRSEFWQDPFDRQLLLSRNLFVIHAVLFDRRLLDYGCRFDTRLPVTEDWDFWLQLSRYTDFVPVRECSAIYRRLGDSGGGLWQSVAADTAKSIEAIFAEKWLRPAAPILEVLLDTGFGYNDREVISRIAPDGLLELSLDLSVFARLRGLRVAAGNLPCVLELLDLQVSCADGSRAQGLVRPGDEVLAIGQLRWFPDGRAALTADFVDHDHRPQALYLRLRVHPLSSALAAALRSTVIPISSPESLDSAALIEQLETLRAQLLAVQQSALAQQIATNH